MYLTGFADEAASDIDGQIRATELAGLRHIEARSVGGTNLHDLSEAEFDAVAGKLERAGIAVNCFGSAIANWGKRIDQPLDASLAEAARAIPRMKRLGAKLIRIMSFAVLEGREPSDQEKAERFRRLRELVALFHAEGLVPVHENCMNYGGMGYPFTLELVSEVPGLKLVFDTGNPVFSDDRSRPKPYPKQDPWQFYTQVKDHIAYVHIKDGVYDPEARLMTYTFPGEGAGQVRRIVEDLLDSGYAGGFSMEPHMKVVFHEGGAAEEGDARVELYVEYVRRFRALLGAIGYG